MIVIYIQINKITTYGNKMLIKYNVVTVINIIDFNAFNLS